MLLSLPVPAEEDSPPEQLCAAVTLIQRFACCNCKVVNPIKDGHQCELAGRHIDLRCSVEAMLAEMCKEELENMQMQDCLIIPR